ncbi:class I SAM-dependent methyltransferase [Mycoplasma sp. 4423]
MHLKNAKSVFSKDTSILKYSLAITNVGLWTSELDLVNKWFRNKQENLLDLGCGAGRTSFNLQELGYQNIYAIDISKEMVDTALQIAKLLPNNTIRFKYMDACDLIFPNNFFEYAFFSFNGFIGIPSEKSRILALKEIYRTLKPNGIFIFTGHLRDEEKYRQRLKLENIQQTQEFKIESKGDLIFKNEDGFYDFFHLYNKDELVNLLTENGFEVISIINRDESYNETKEVIEFADNTYFWICKKV